MNLFKRLINLWRISALDIRNTEHKKTLIDKILRKKEQATVVDMHDPLSIDLH